MDADVAVALRAEKQFGAFSRKQAMGDGHSAWMIRHRLDTGRWISLHPGVYALVGSPDTWWRRQMAACLWAQGVASGVAAGFLYGLPGCDEPPLEVLTHRSLRQMPRCGVIVHATNRLPREQMTMVKNIPCTTIERTLLDLAGRFTERDAAIAVDNALFRRLTTLGSLDHCLFLTARRGRNGCGLLRKLIHKRAGMSEVPNSPLETVIFDLILEEGLPKPLLQHRILDESGRFVARPDFFYLEHGLVIEGQSRLWHEGVYAEEEDRRREAALRELGLRTVYLWWADVTTYRRRTAAMLHDFLTSPERGIDPLS